MAALGPASPTGIAAVDALYVGGCGAALVFAGGRSRRYTWVLSAAISLWLTPAWMGRVLCVVAIGLGAWSLRTGRRRWVGALAALLLVPVLGHLEAGPFLGSTTLLALLAASPMLASALVHLPRRRQRTVVAAVTIAIAGAVVATFVFAATVGLTRDAVADGVDAARRGFAAGSDDDSAASADHFDEAAEHFDEARGLLGGPWSLPARLVPVVGQHVRAAQVVASEGTSLARVAADSVDTIDPDQVRVEDGSLDLTVIDGLAPTLDRIERSLSRALDRVSGATDDWLVGPVDDRLGEMLVELQAAVPAATTAATAALHVPEMLGADGPVHWLVLLSTPAEARGLGGLVGNYLLVRADDGRVELVESGRNEDINGLLAANDAELTGPPDFVDQWGSATERFFQDVTLAPDLPTVATVAADLYEQATGTRIDGVVSVDPYVMGAIVDLTGPIQVAGATLGPAQVVDFLLVDQYATFDSEEERVAALDELARGTFEAVTSVGLPGPRGLAESLGPLVGQDRLGVWWSAGGGPEEVIDAAGLDSRFPRPDGADLVAVVHQNAGQNKIDVLLERSLGYDLRHDGRRVEGTITVTLYNTSPSTGLPDAVIGSNDQGLPPGTNRANLAVHTALDLVGARLDGEPIDVARHAVYEAEAVSTTIDVPAGARRVFEVDVRGEIDSGPYRLWIPHQPLTDDDTVTVRIVDAEGSVVEALLDGNRPTTDLLVQVDG